MKIKHLVDFKIQFLITHKVDSLKTLKLKLRSFLNFPLGKNLAFVDLRTFALVEGKKMKSEITFNLK